VLEALGVNLNLTPEQVGHSIDQIGIGFMFAPNFHGAMKYAAPVRKELGVRTMFNVLGPLTNPAAAENQVMGVFHPDLVGIQARVLQRLGSRHVLVVNGSDGLDEITISGASNVAELKNGEVTEYTVTPEQFGLQSTSLDAIKVSNAAEAKAMLLGVLDNKPGAARDIVLLNAGAAIYVAGLTDTLASGVKKAAEIIASGAAKDKLAQLVQISNA
jgi:anthranilate phosphoribosyltransferase